MRLSFPENNAHLCGQGSTLAGVWAKGLEHFEYQFKGQKKANVSSLD